jgi:hypothetical protein
MALDRCAHGVPSRCISSTYEHVAIAWRRLGDDGWPREPDDLVHLQRQEPDDQPARNEHELLGDGQNELTGDGTSTLHNSILDTTSRTASGTTDYFTRDDQGLLLADRGPSSTKYYLLDPLGSVIAITSSTGAVSASYNYDPYGGSIGTAPSPCGYTSGYRTASGRYHYGARPTLDPAGPGAAGLSPQ